jgi:hypothetical protein
LVKQVREMVRGETIIPRSYGSMFRNAAYKARAAANIPAAPPTRAMAPVGRGPAGAKPVLGVGAAAPDPEPDAPEADAPEPDGPEPDALEADALGVAPELSGVFDASTTATVFIASKSDMKLEGMIVVVVPRSEAST